MVNCSPQLMTDQEIRDFNRPLSKQPLKKDKFETIM